MSSKWSEHSAARMNLVFKQPKNNDKSRRSYTVPQWILYIFQGLFPPGQGATIGVDFMIKTVDVDGDKVKVCTVL